MVKIFFVTFFLAELVIAIAVISKLLCADRYVKALDGAITLNRSKIKICFTDFRLLLVGFTSGLQALKETIQKKQDDYLFAIVKNSLIYSIILFSKGNLRKAILSYQLGKEIYEGLKESKE